MTIDINNAMQKLFDKKLLDERCKENINLLIEVRDNAIHFINKSADLSRKVQEIGTAGLSNYVTAMDEWFGKDLSQYNFYLMPMSFFHLTDLESHSVLNHNRQIENVLKHFQEVESRFPPDEDASYNITLRIRTQFVKTYAADKVIEVKYTDDPDAPEVRVSEENIFKYKYPMTYSDLIGKLKNRYTDFKLDRRFHTIRKELEDQRKYEERFCKVNYLDVIGKQGSQRKFWVFGNCRETPQHLAV